MRNGGSGTIGLKNVPLSIPETDGDALVVLPPLFPDPGGKWMLVRSKSRRGQERPFPFLMGEEPYLPGAHPVLAGGQAARLSVVGYNWGDGELEVRGRVRSAGAGDEGREVTLDATERMAGAMPGSDALVATFTPEGMDSGEYELEVTVRDTTGREQSSVIPFEIRN